MKSNAKYELSVKITSYTLDEGDDDIQMYRTDLATGIKYPLYAINPNNRFKISQKLMKQYGPKKDDLSHCPKWKHCFFDKAVRKNPMFSGWKDEDGGTSIGHGMVGWWVWGKCSRCGNISREYFSQDELECVLNEYGLW